MINCGNIGTVSLTTEYVRNSSWTGSNFVISLHFFNDSLTDHVRVLGISQEGWFNATTTSLQSGSYTVNLVTGRGSSSASTFTAQDEKQQIKSRKKGVFIETQGYFYTLGQTAKTFYGQSIPLVSLSCY